MLRKISILYYYIKILHFPLDIIVIHIACICIINKNCIIQLYYITISDYITMADVAVDRSVSEQVTDIIFDAIKSIRKKSKRADTISITEHITRNPTNFKEVELRDSIAKLVDSGILINNKTKQDLGILFVNEGASTDNTPQGQNNALPDITSVDTETPNCTLAEACTKNLTATDLMI